MGRRDELISEYWEKIGEESWSEDKLKNDIIELIGFNMHPERAEILAEQIVDLVKKSGVQL